MKKNKYLSMLIASLFLCNMVFSNISTCFSQGMFKVDENLAPSYVFEKNLSTEEVRQMGLIKLALETYLKLNEDKGIRDIKEIEGNFFTDLYFFFGEMTDDVTQNSFIQNDQAPIRCVKCRVQDKDKVDENGRPLLKTYYAAFSVKDDLNGFPIEVYTEGEWQRLITRANVYGPHQGVPEREVMLSPLTGIQHNDIAGIIQEVGDILKYNDSKASLTKILSTKNSEESMFRFSGYKIKGKQKSMRLNASEDDYKSAIVTFIDRKSEKYRDVHERKYYIAFKGKEISLDNLEVYTEEEWQEISDKQIPQYELPKRYLEYPVDSLTIERYLEHDNTIDRFIKENIRKKYSLILPRDADLEYYQKYYNNPSPKISPIVFEEILDFVTDTLSGIGVEKKTINDLYDAIKDKPIVLFHYKDKKQLPVITGFNENGELVKMQVEAHSSDNAVYVFIKETEDQEYITRKIKQLLLYEAGVHFGLPGLVNDSGQLENEVTLAYKEHMADPGSYLPSEIIKNLKVVRSLSETSIVRDYATGKVSSLYDVRKRIIEEIIEFISRGPEIFDDGENAKMKKFISDFFVDGSNIKNLTELHSILEAIKAESGLNAKLEEIFCLRHNINGNNAREALLEAIDIVLQRNNFNLHDPAYQRLQELFAVIKQQGLFPECENSIAFVSAIKDMDVSRVLQVVEYVKEQIKFASKTESKRRTMERLRVENILNASVFLGKKSDDQPGNGIISVRELKKYLSFLKDVLDSAAMDEKTNKDSMEWLERHLPELKDIQLFEDKLQRIREIFSKYQGSYEVLEKKLVLMEKIIEWLNSRPSQKSRMFVKDAINVKQLKPGWVICDFVLTANTALTGYGGVWLKNKNAYIYNLEEEITMKIEDQLEAQGTRPESPSYKSTFNSLYNMALDEESKDFSKLLDELARANVTDVFTAFKGLLSKWGKWEIINGYDSRGANMLPLLEDILAATSSEDIDEIEQQIEKKEQASDEDFSVSPYIKQCLQEQRERPLSPHDKICNYLSRMRTYVDKKINSEEEAEQKQASVLEKLILLLDDVDKPIAIKKTNTESVISKLKKREAKDIAMVELAMEWYLSASKGTIDKIKQGQMNFKTKLYEFSRSHFNKSIVSFGWREPLPSGKVKIKWEIADTLQGPVKEFYVILTPGTEKGTFEIEETYMQREWEASGDVIANSRTLPKRKDIYPEDAEAIRRAKEHEENLDKWIEDEIKKGGYFVSSLTISDEKLKTLYPKNKGIIAKKEYIKIVRSVGDKLIKLGVDRKEVKAFIELLKKKPLVVWSGLNDSQLPKLTMLDENHNPVEIGVQAHSSDSAVYMMLLKGEKISKRIEELLLYEAGVHFKELGVVDGNAKLQNIITKAYGQYMKSPSGYSPSQQIKDLTLADSLKDVSSTRDYAAGKTTLENTALMQKNKDLNKLSELIKIAQKLIVEDITVFFDTPDDKEKSEQRQWLIRTFLQLEVPESLEEQKKLLLRLKKLFDGIDVKELIKRKIEDIREDIKQNEARIKENERRDIRSAIHNIQHSKSLQELAEIALSGRRMYVCYPEEVPNKELVDFLFKYRNKPDQRSSLDMSVLFDEWFYKGQVPEGIKVVAKKQKDLINYIRSVLSHRSNLDEDDYDKYIKEYSAKDEEVALEMMLKPDLQKRGRLLSIMENDHRRVAVYIIDYPETRVEGLSPEKKKDRVIIVIDYRSGKYRLKDKEHALMNRYFGCQNIPEFKEKIRRLGGTKTIKTWLQLYMAREMILSNLRFLETRVAVNSIKFLKEDEQGKSILDINHLKTVNGICDLLKRFLDEGPLITMRDVEMKTLKGMFSRPLDLKEIHSRIYRYKELFEKQQALAHALYDWLNKGRTPEQIDFTSRLLDPPNKEVLQELIRVILHDQDYTKSDPELVQWLERTYLIHKLRSDKTVAENLNVFFSAGKDEKEEEPVEDKLFEIITNPPSVKAVEALNMMVVDGESISYVEGFYEEEANWIRGIYYELYSKGKKKQRDRIIEKTLRGAFKKANIRPIVKILHNSIYEIHKEISWAIRGARLRPVMKALKEFIKADGMIGEWQQLEKDRADYTRTIFYQMESIYSLHEVKSVIDPMMAELKQIEKALHDEPTNEDSFFVMSEIRYYYGNRKKWIEAMEKDLLEDEKQSIRDLIMYNASLEELKVLYAFKRGTYPVLDDGSLELYGHFVQQKGPHNWSKDYTEYLQSINRRLSLGLPMTLENAKIDNLLRSRIKVLEEKEIISRRLFGLEEEHTAVWEILDQQYISAQINGQVKREKSVRKRNGDKYQRMLDNANNIGTRAALPVAKYTLVTSNDLYQDKDLNVDKGVMGEKIEGVGYKHRFNIVRLNHDDSAGILKQIKGLIDGGINAKDIIVQISNPINQYDILKFLSREKYQGVRFIVVNTETVKNETSEDIRAYYRRDLYMLMALSRMIANDTSRDMKLYELLRYCLVEKWITDDLKSDKDFSIEKYIKAIETLDLSILLHQILAFKPVEELTDEMVSENRQLTATFIYA